MSGPDPVQTMANHLAHPADMAWHHKQRWIERMTELRQGVRDASDEEARARAKQAVLDHYHERGNVKPTRAAMMRAAAAKVPDSPNSEELDLIAREAVGRWHERQDQDARQRAAETKPVGADPT